MPYFRGWVEFLSHNSLAKIEAQFHETEKFENCCSAECAEIAKLPIENQRKLRKTPSKAAPLKQFQNSIKPKLKELIQNRKKANQ